MLKIHLKYFVGYRHKGNAFPSSLCIKLLQMNAYAKCCDNNNKEILKKYSGIWD